MSQWKWTALCDSMETRPPTCQMRLCHSPEQSARWNRNACQYRIAKSKKKVRGKGVYSFHLIAFEKQISLSTRVGSSHLSTAAHLSHTEAGSGDFGSLLSAGRRFTAQDSDIHQDLGTWWQVKRFKHKRFNQGIPVQAHEVTAEIIW